MVMIGGRRVTQEDAEVKMAQACAGTDWRLAEQQPVRPEAPEVTVRVDRATGETWEFDTLLIDALSVEKLRAALPTHRWRVTQLER